MARERAAAPAPVPRWARQPVWSDWMTLDQFGAELEARGELVRVKLFYVLASALDIAGIDVSKPPWPALPGDRADAPASGRPPAWLRRQALAQVEAAGWPAPA